MEDGRPQYRSRDNRRKHDDHSSHERHPRRRAHEHYHRSSSDGKDSPRPSLAHNTLPKKPTDRVVVKGIALSREEKEAGEFYSVDRRGDVQNLLYGSLSQYEIPKYRPVGFGGVLGLDSSFRISRETRQVEKIQADPGARSRHGQLSLLSSRPKDDGVPIDISIEAGEDAVKLQRDYVPIGRARRRCLSRENSRGIDDTQEEETSDTDASSPSEVGGENAFDAFRDDKVHQRRLTLARSTRDNPEDVEAWLELAEHQNSAGFAKIGIYEKALAGVKSLEGRQRLLLKLLSEGRKLWDTNKLFEKWKAVLKEAGKDNIGLWLRYLELQQTTMSSFTVDGCVKLYIKCLMHAKELQDAVRRDEICIYVLLRCTTFLRQAGFMERAIAIWQALIEWTLFAPDQGDRDEQEEMRAFENWWDGEVARIGEEGAKGWRKNDDATIALRQDLGFGPDTVPRDRDEAWASREEQYARRSRVPARALDDVSSEDPFRMVLYSDIKDFLFRPVAPRGRQLLVDAFLIFCNLPPLSGQARKWWIDPLLRDVDLAVDGEASDTSIPDISSGKLTWDFGLDIATLFSDLKKWFCPWSKSQHSDDPWTTVDSDWRHRSLRQLVGALPAHDLLAEYVVALDLSIDASTARKYAKSLLKKRPDSLRLYNSFAIVESRVSNHDAAEKVWATALSLSKAFDMTNQKDIFLLWRTWVWDALERRDYRRSVRLILAIPDGQFDLEVEKATTLTEPVTLDNARAESEVASRARYLSAKRYLEAQLASQLRLGDQEATIHVADLLAILAYLTADRSLAAAQDVYQHTLKSIAEGNENVTEDFQVELVHQSRARLLHFHATVGSQLGYRPAQISQILTESLNRFPENTIFLSLHNYHTRRHLIDRLRDTTFSRLEPLNQTRDQHFPGLERESKSEESEGSNLPSAAFSIRTELARPILGGRTEHSIRAAFTRALDTESSSTHISPGIWLAYLSWEISLRASPSQEDSKLSYSSKAQKRLLDLFYGALRCCPYFKPIYLLAFTSSALRLAIGGPGLQEVYDTMIEKGIRLHRELR